MGGYFPAVWEEGIFNFSVFILVFFTISFIFFLIFSIFLISNLTHFEKVGWFYFHVVFRILH